MKNHADKIVVTIVNKGKATKIIKKLKEKEFFDHTILYGTGTAHKHKTLYLLGIDSDPEKEIILSYTNEEKLEALLEYIVTVSNIDKPGRGICFVVPLNTSRGRK